MARIRLFHTKADEAEPLLASLRRAGHEVQYAERPKLGDVRAGAPEIVIIDLTRLPSHGREVAAYIRGTKALRHLPLVFAGGDPLKVDQLREIIPDAVYTSWAKVDSVIEAAIANVPSNVVIPTRMMDRYGDRTVAQKLGIEAGSVVRIIDPPPGFPSVLGDIPDGVSFIETERGDAAVTLWFIYEIPDYLGSLAKRRGIARQSKLWIVWPKGDAGKQAGINQNVIRTSAMDAGLVDYKVCAVNEHWSAMLFAGAKAESQKGR